MEVENGAGSNKPPHSKICIALDHLSEHAHEGLDGNKHAWSMNMLASPEERGPLDLITTIGVEGLEVSD